VNLLLDTHILLWAAGQPDRLSEKCKNLLLHPSNTLNFSAASLWEISIKFSLGRSDFNLSGLNSPPLAVKYVKLFLKPDTPLLAAGSLHCNCND